MSFISRILIPCKICKSSPRNWETVSVMGFLTIYEASDERTRVASSGNTTWRRCLQGEEATTATQPGPISVEHRESMLVAWNSRCDVENSS